MKKRSNRIKTQAGSFPKFPHHQGLRHKAKKEWQVLCGDRNHWRVGYYSPPETKNSEVKRLEKHSCLELFLLLEGELTLILDEGKGEYELKLKRMKPVMVEGWHSGYCPKGAYQGIALVVERDQFSTIYRERGFPREK